MLFRSVAGASSDSVADESESEGVDVTEGELPTSVLERVSSKTNPTAMMIAQMTFLLKRITSLRNIIDRESDERNSESHAGYAIARSRPQSALLENLLSTKNRRL